jgi:hypothetical protein
MEGIKQFIIEENVYERMIEMRDDNNDMPWDSYDEFYEWNMNCLSESPDDVAWLNSLCKRMASSKIQLMDEESCVRMPAYAFYFDNNKNIVIVNPR